MSNSIKSTWNIGLFFLVFTIMFYNVYFALDTINRNPPVLQKQFGTVIAGMGENQKMGYVFQVKLNQVNVKYRFVFLGFHNNVS